MNVASPDHPFHLKVPAISRNETTPDTHPFVSFEIPASNEAVTQSSPKRLTRVRRELLTGWTTSFLRRFVIGTGISVFLGALTIIFVGPPPDSNVNESSRLRDDNIQVATDTVSIEGRSHEDILRPQVELTVSTTDQANDVKTAEFLDPFIPENQVRAGNVVNAVHHQHPDESNRTIIRTKHQTRTDQPHRESPSWLTGEIEPVDSTSNHY